MSADTDRFGERLAHVEGTVEQMDKRIADLSTRMNERFDTLESRFDASDRRMDTLDEKIEQNRREMRRLLLVLFAGLSLVVAVVSVVVQIAL